MSAQPSTTATGPGKRMRVPHPVGAASWLAVALMWIALAFNSNFRSWTTGILQPAIVREFGVSASTMGLFSGGVSFAVGLCAVPLSVWADRGGAGWRRKYRLWPIAAAEVVLVLLSGTPVLTGSLLALFVIQFLHRPASGAAEMVEVTTVGEWWPIQRRGFALGLHHTSVPWGTFLGGLAVSGILAAVGGDHWRVVLLTIPLGMVPVLIAWWLLSTRRRYAAFVDRTVATGETPPLATPAEGERAVPKGAVGRALRNPNVMVSSVIFGVAMMVYLGVNSWLPLYLNFVAHYNLASSAVLSVIYTITAGVGQIVWGALSDRLGRKAMLVLLFVWMAAGLLGLQIVGWGLGALIGAQLFLGMATNAVYPILYATAADSVEPGANGIATGFNVTAQSLGGIGPIVVGFLIDAGGGYSSASGYMWALVVMAAAMLACAVVVLLFTRETTGWWRRHDRSLLPGRSRSSTAIEEEK
ncbi:MAG TPA: MFS transporter [Pseudonocardiaceae bacterium]|jgi:MFS family permease|nr:MFS transporter [Pseudonocardiaceae bacterium]